jgi:hypothetical protein
MYVLAAQKQAKSQRGGSAPARITTPRAPRPCTGCGWATPGPSPMRGSQHAKELFPLRGRVQRPWGLSSGEDHNDITVADQGFAIAAAPGAPAPARITTPTSPLRCCTGCGAAPGPRSRRGSQPEPADPFHPQARAAPGLRPWRGSKQRLVHQRRRRLAGSAEAHLGEDHNVLKAILRLGEDF